MPLVPTQPAPFTEMPLGWDRSYGGKKYAQNPLGRLDGQIGHLARWEFAGASGAGVARIYDGTARASARAALPKRSKVMQQVRVEPLDASPRP